MTHSLGSHRLGVEAVRCHLLRVFRASEIDGSVSTPVAERMEPQEETTEEPVEGSPTSDPGGSGFAVFLIYILVAVAMGALLISGWDFLVPWFQKQ